MRSIRGNVYGERLGGGLSLPRLEIICPSAEDRYRVEQDRLNALVPSPYHRCDP